MLTLLEDLTLNGKIDSTLFMAASKASASVFFQDLDSTYEALSALDNGIISPNFTVKCEGKKEMYGQIYHCWKKEGHGFMNLKEAMKHTEVFQEKLYNEIVGRIKKASTLVVIAIE